MSEETTKQITLWTSLLVVVLVLAWWFWPTITRAVVVHDLRGFAAEIRKSDLDVQVKIALLDQIDAIEDQLDKGRSIGLFQWRASSGAIEEVLARDVAAKEAVPLVQRELKQVERRLR